MREGRVKGRRAGRNAAVIDTHAHWYPREFISLLQEGAAANGASMDRTADGHPVFALPDVLPKSVMRPSMIEPDLMVKAMNKRRVDTYTLTLTNPMVYWATPDFGRKLSQTWNDASTAVHGAFPGRFIGTIMLPMQTPDLALQELNRASRLPGLRAVHMATHVNGKNLDEREFWPVFARCEALGLPIFLHPLYPCADDRMGKHFMRNLCGNPYETGLAAASLVLGGVMDAFPKLVVMLPQAGGTFPWLVGRFDRGLEVRKEAEAHEAQADRVPSPFRLRHDQPPPRCPALSHRPGGRRPRRSRQRLRPGHAVRAPRALSGKGPGPFETRARYDSE